MKHSSLQTIREEHASLAAMLQSLRMMLKRGPGTDPICGTRNAYQTYARDKFEQLPSSIQCRKCQEQLAEWASTVPATALACSFRTSGG